MFYVWQSTGGRWHVDAYTSAPRSAHALAFRISGSDTRADAEAKRADAVRTWADVDAASRALTA